MYHFFSSCFQDFFGFVFISRCLILLWAWISWCLLFGVHQTSETCTCVELPAPAMWRLFQPLNLQVFFHSCILPFSFWNDIKDRSFIRVPQVPETLFSFFQSIFSLCCSNRVISIAPSSSSLTLTSVSPILMLLIFLLIIVIFSSKISILFSIFYFCIKTYYFTFCFKMVCDHLLKNFFYIFEN